MAGQPLASLLQLARHQSPSGRPTQPVSDVNSLSISWPALGRCIDGPVSALSTQLERVKRLPLVAAPGATDDMRTRVSSNDRRLRLPASDAVGLARDRRR